ncbi:MAG: glycosyltransferase family 2 protein [Nanoarchaeota archaeon]|nr:glycosyltransferase family 2 protein [Nanoarchaeota archaeon]MBU1501370.1 glycosyltransferase family 2 protein [Nanoarchaeota archaeon]
MVKQKRVKSPLVSVNIPTFNSEKTLGKTIESVKSQTYPEIEILIVDSHSKDKTLEIAKQHECKIVMCKGGLLEARMMGAEESKGEYVLFLDSDQILEPETIGKCVEAIKDKDYLWLYERAYNREKWLPSLYDADRILVQEYMKEGNDLSVVLPRFFKRTLLMKVFKNIPKDAIPLCSAQDHIITTYEIKKLTDKIGSVGNKGNPGVQHIEPDNIIKLIKKQYRWGQVTREFHKTGFYSELIVMKHKYRKFDGRDFSLSIKSFILRTLRGVPYFAGFWFG